MSKLFTRAAFVAAAGYPGATALTQRGLLWDALQTLGLTDSNRATVTATANLTLAQCGLLLVDATAGNVVLTLPTASAAADEAIYLIRRIDATANTVTVQRASTDTIEGAATALAVLPAGMLELQLPAGSTNWRVLYIGGATPAAARAAIGVAATTVDQARFYKADTSTVAFIKTAAGTASVKAGTEVVVAGTTVTFNSATAIVMPALTAGTDYAIYACTDGTVRADASFTAPSGYTTANSRKIGGFHYAPGGNAAAQAGGDTTPQINEYSLWDLKFRPACTDPRGMTLVADGFWSDIYLLGVDHLTNGTSKYNVTIADGSSPPKIPVKFGGNGSSAYGSLNRWEAAEALMSYGKRLPDYGEFAALAYGTTEASSGGTDPGSTILRAAYTSRYGVMLASGNLYVWGSNFGGGAAGAAWTANTGGRGSTYQMENAVIFGGSWVEGADSGSRCSAWSDSPTNSPSAVSARGVCDHLILD